jgi:hypothetical protein
MTINEKKNSALVKEFDRYVLEHPEFAENIPNSALVVMQVDGDEEFNQWNRGLAEKQAEESQPIVYVKIKRMRPIQSRIEELELEQADME